MTYVASGVLQDAVALALTFDRALASAVAARAEDDEALQRKLWLAIARHLIDAASEKCDSDPVCSYHLVGHSLVLLQQTMLTCDGFRFAPAVTPEEIVLG